jgi:RNA-dependent RNA polymerase
MNQREIGTEFEVWSTFVMSKPRVGSDYKVQEDMGLVMTGLRDRFSQACIERAEAQSPGTEEMDREKLYPFVAAMYRVTWEEVQIAIQEWQETRMIAGRLVSKRSKDQMPFISFPWLFETDLGRIATSATAAAMQLGVLPAVPAVSQATSVDEAMTCVAASLEDGRLYHRGDEVFVTTLDVEPEAEESSSISGWATTPAESDVEASTEKLPPAEGSSMEAVEKAEESEVEEIEDEVEIIEEEIEDGKVTSCLTALHRLAVDSDDE